MWFNEKRIFVTGTDTDVGKTFVSIKILQMFRENGLNPSYFKPVATGCVYRNSHLVSEDVLKVKQKTGIDEPDNLLNPVAFEVPAAPLIASEISGVPVQLTKIRSAYEELCQKYEAMVVEGAGGIMVPITNNYLVLDLIKELKLPVVIVSKAVLGTINHTVLTVRVLKDFGIKICGIIISYPSDIDPGISVQASFDVIQNITGVPVIKRFPFEMDWE